MGLDAPPASHRRRDAGRNPAGSASRRSKRHAPDKVLIHDAARPFVSSDLIAHVIAWLDRFPAVIPGMPVAETAEVRARRHG